MTSPSVLVVGAGISGLACARSLAGEGVSVRVVDRGRVPGGRMASRRLEGRPVDLGASYFTAPEGSAIASIVADWTDRGLARPWTDTFAVAGPEGIRDTSTGPMRYSAPDGLRSLTVDLAEGLGVELEHAVESVRRIDGGIEVSAADGIATRFDAVVLAMPDPQASRLLAADDPALASLAASDGWDPVIAIALGWAARPWSGGLHGAFVNDSPSVGFLADDGDRRGDGAGVLVAHTTPELAREHLDEPDGAIAPVAGAVMRMLGITAPDWTYAHRWTFAKPSAPHPEPFFLDARVGVCGDGWGGKSSVGAAWTSGDALGRELATRL